MGVPVLLELSIPSPPGMDFPRRPPWSFAMSREELRAREEAAFTAFLKGLPGEGGSNGELAPFEHNLEVGGGWGGVLGGWEGTWGSWGVIGMWEGAWGG